ncbi:MAG: hypothetical protein EOP84_13310, partial [Verrucomicrobiaceae bacterium]
MFHGHRRRPRLWPFLSRRTTAQNFKRRRRKRTRRTLLPQLPAWRAACLYGNSRAQFFLKHPSPMAFLNDNYLKLRAGYLFPEIAR